MDAAQIAFAAVTAITRSASSTWKVIDPPDDKPKIAGEFWFDHEKTFGIYRVVVVDGRATDVEQYEAIKGDDEDEDDDDDKVVLSRDDRAFINGLERAKIVLFLEETLGIACYDSESTSLLREALIANVADGSTPVDDVRCFMDQIDEVESSIRSKGVTDFEMKVIQAGLV